MFQTDLVALFCSFHAFPDVRPPEELPRVTAEEMAGISSPSLILAVIWSSKNTYDLVGVNIVNETPWTILQDKRQMQRMASRERGSKVLDTERVKQCQWDASGTAKGAQQPQASFGFAPSPSKLTPFAPTPAAPAAPFRPAAPPRVEARICSIGIFLATNERESQSTMSGARHRLVNYRSQ